MVSSPVRRKQSLVQPHPATADSQLRTGRRDRDRREHRRPHWRAAEDHSRNSKGPRASKERAKTARRNLRVTPSHIADG